MAKIKIRAARRGGASNSWPELTLTLKLSVPGPSNRTGLFIKVPGFDTIRLWDMEEMRILRNTLDALLDTDATVAALTAPAAPVVSRTCGCKTVDGELVPCQGHVAQVDARQARAAGWADVTDETFGR